MSPSRPASLRRRLDALGLRMGARLDADWADQSMPWVFAAVLFGLLLAMSLAVVRQLDGGPGLGVWSQAAWNLRAGRAPTSTLGGANVVTVQWSYVAYPVLWLTHWIPAPQTFAIVQTLALALAVVPLWRLARGTFDLRVGTTAAIVGAYALAPAVHAVNLSLFHPEVVAVPAFAWAALHWRRGHWVRFGLCVLLMLACRADIGATVAGLGLLILVDGNRLAGLVTMAVGAGWSGAAIAALDPELPKGPLTAGRAFVAQGTVPLAELRQCFTDPGAVLSHIGGQQTVVVVIALFAPLLFLSFAAPRTLIPAVPGFVLGTAAGQVVEQASEVGVPHGALGAGRVLVAIVPITLAGLVALTRIGRRSVSRINVDHRLVGAVAIASLLLFVEYAPSSPYEHPWAWGGRNATDEAILDAVDAVPRTMPITVSPQITPEVAERAVVHEAWLGPPPQPSAWRPTTGVVILDTTATDDTGSPLWTSASRRSELAALERQHYRVSSDQDGIVSLKR